MKILELKTEYNEIHPSKDVDEIIEEAIEKLNSLSDIDTTLKLYETLGAGKYVSGKRKKFFGKWGSKITKDSFVSHKGVGADFLYKHPRDIANAYNDVSLLSQATGIPFDIDEVKFDSNIFKGQWWTMADEISDDSEIAKFDDLTVACVRFESNISSAEERKSLGLLATKINYPVKKGRKYMTESYQGGFRSGTPSTEVILELKGSFDELKILEFFNNVNRVHMKELGIDKVKDNTVYHIDLREGNVHQVIFPRNLNNKNISYEIDHKILRDSVNQSGKKLEFNLTYCDW